MLSPTTKDPPRIEVKIVTQYDEYIPAFYRTFYCDSGNVREALAPEVEYFTPRDPTLVVGPPGSHKTTFALLELVSRAVKSGKNVLIVLNRVALATQLKQRVLDITESPLRGCLTNKGIQATEHFGNISIITYHRLPAFVKDPANAERIRNLMYVVADEAHVITSDISFNEHCGYYLKLLTKKFQHAIRIYMTATEWDVLVPLAEAEEKNYVDNLKVVYPGVRPREFRRYVFPVDYSHINLCFFTDLQEIKDEIHSNPKEKWLIFAGSKKEGTSLVKELGDKAIYLDADSKDTEAWYQLLQDNKFRVQVLVTTPVLDCGVNIIDENLRNVVIFTDDRTRLIQMFGRKRRKPDEEVNLFVYDLDEKTITKRQQEGHMLCQWLDRYEEADPDGRKKMAAEIWRSPQDGLRHYFSLANGYLVPNQVAFYALKRKMHFYEELLSGKTTFRQAVTSWLGLDEKEVPETEKLSLAERIEKFCEARLEQQLSDAEIEELRSLVAQIKTPNGASKTRPDRVKTIKKIAVNHRLSDIACPYRVARDAWRIIKNMEE